MVLFYTTFVALKAWCPLTLNTNPEEYKLAGEDRLFQAYLHLSLLGPVLTDPCLIGEFWMMDMNTP
jgi:hypothetical protein